MACNHWPHCPAAESTDAKAARLVADHWEQGWALLCNGIVVFDDGGLMLPQPAAA